VTIDARRQLAREVRPGDHGQRADLIASVGGWLAAGPGPRSPV
jgi:hypothetical protein